MKMNLDIRKKKHFQETPFSKRQQNILPRTIEWLRDATNASE